MENIEEQIVALEQKVSFIETLLEKDYSDWTNKEKNKYGNHEQLRKEEEQLREEKIQLREKENLLLKQHLAQQGNSIINCSR
jgi:hypothetical protein